MLKGNWFDERVILVVAIIFSIFTAVVLSEQLGLIYFSMIIAYGLFILISKQKLPFTKKTISFAVIPVILILLGAWLIVSQLYLNSVIPEAVNPIALLTEQATLPELIQEPNMRLLIWGIYIPLVETLFLLGVLVPFLFSFFRQKGYDFRKPMVWMIAVLVGSISALFHLKARLLSPGTANSALIVDFLFFFVSALIVMKQGQLFEAFVAHSVLNSYVILGG